MTGIESSEPRSEDARGIFKTRHTTESNRRESTVISGFYQDYFKRWVILPVISVLMCISCGHSDSSQISEAMGVVEQRPDSAFALLKGIEFANLSSDKDKADYVLTRAKADMYLGRSLMTDSLLPTAISYYNSVSDSVSAFQAILAQAYHLRSIERYGAANALLDSLYSQSSALPDKQKHINKVLLDFSFKDKDFNRSLCLINRHLKLTDDESERLEYELKKITPLNSLGRSKEGAALCDSLVALPSAPEEGSREWMTLRLNQAASLGENRSTAGRAAEIMEDLIVLIGEVPDKLLPELYIPMANIQLNAGNINEARKYIGLIDSLDIDPTDYDVVARAYLDFLKIVIDYEKTGALSFSQISNVAHNLRKVSNNLEIKKQERDDALESAYDLSRSKYELTIGHQRLWLTLSVVIIIAIIVTVLISYVSHKRRQRLLDAEEKIDTLEELVKSAQNASSEDKQGYLKKILLQHLGIIKTFAESPTSQNQEALRKISGAGGTGSRNGSLVDWDNFYPIIDELYTNFHNAILTQYPDLFSEREINILCLIRAGFSTKEIGVLVEQTSNSIYVSKTSIRKKLGVGAKEDIMAYLTSKFGTSGMA